MQKFNQLGNSSIELLDVQGFPMGTSSNTTGLDASTNLSRRGALSRVGKMGAATLLPMSGGLLLPSVAKAGDTPVGSFIGKIAGSVTIDLWNNVETRKEYLFYNQLLSTTTTNISYTRCRVYERTLLYKPYTQIILDDDKVNIYYCDYAANDFLRLRKRNSSGGWDAMLTLDEKELKSSTNEGCRNDARRLQASTGGRMDAQTIRAWLGSIFPAVFMAAITSDPLVNLPAQLSGYADEIFYITFTLGATIELAGRIYNRGQYHCFFCHAKGTTSSSGVALPTMLRSYFVHKNTAETNVVNAVDKAVEQFGKYSAAISAAKTAGVGMAVSTVGVVVCATSALTTQVVAPMAAGAITLAVAGVAGWGTFRSEIQKANSAAREYTAFMSTMGVTELGSDDSFQCDAINAV